MRPSRLTFPAFALIVLVTPAATMAQPSGEVAFDTPIQWTMSADAATERRQDIGASVSLDHLLAGERVRVFYDLAMDAFGTEGGARTWLHNAGVMGTIGDERRALVLGGSVFWRANQGEWAAAGFSGVSAVTTVRLQPRQTFTAAASYALYVRRFADEPALDQNEHYGSIRSVANLPSHTTVAAILSIGRKHYDGRETLLTWPGTSSEGISGRGHGWRRTFSVPAQATVSGAPGARAQWTWAARVAQALDDRTGVWIEREERRTRGDLPPSIVWTPPLFYDDGVYDDPYVIDARTWRAGVKHVFGAGPEISSEVTYSDRAYAGLARNDTLTRASLEASLPVMTGERLTLDLTGGYGYFRNESSDLLEDYRAHVVRAGLRFAF